MFSRVVFNGSLQDENHYTHVSVLSPSFQYGLTVFEGIRIYKTNENRIIIFKLTEHIKRLINSCKLIGFESIPNEEVIRKDIELLINYQQINCNCYLKYIIAMCSEGTWQSRSPIDRVVFYYPLKSNLINDEPKKVVSAFSKINKFPSTSMPAKIKCGANYINSRHAYLDVNANSSEEIIPILLDSKGFGETSGSSVFVIKGNKVLLRI